MYQNIYYDRSKELIHLWDDENGYSVFPFERYAYQTNPKGQFQTIFGDKAIRVNNWSDSAVKEGIIHEHDVPATTRTLIDRYLNSDELSQNHRIFYFDIEVEKGDKYSTAADADNVITSIAYCFNGRYVCMVLDRERKLSSSTLSNGTDLMVYRSEFQLLSAFISQINQISPTIITGWNCETFDLPYLYNRMIKILGTTQANKISPIGIVKPREIRKDVAIEIAGISIMDYLVLYKIFTYSEQSSYTLDAIANKELGRGKIAYDGDLDTLYQTDIDKFIQYNVTDVELVVALDKKLDFIDIARGTCHKGHVPYQDIVFPTRYLDGASLTYAKRQGKVVARGIRSSDETAAIGAFVKTPTPGIYRYVFDIDCGSMYPSNIMTLNISPETKFGKVDNWDGRKFITSPEDTYHVNTYVKTLGDELFGKKPQVISISGKDFRNWMDENNLCISSNGVLYRTDIPGLIPSILSLWFDERKQFRKTAEERHKQHDLDGYRYFDKKQMVQKILLNSFYGVLLNSTFRFYDKDNGEAVTTTGQSLLDFAMRMCNQYYNKRIGGTYIDYCIYGDTDSVGFESLIHTNLGTMPIGQLFERFESISHIDSTNREFTFPHALTAAYYDILTKSARYGLVQYIERHLIRKRMYRITTKTGKSVRVTADHAIMVLHNGELIAKTPAQISTHDIVVCIKE